MEEEGCYHGCDTLGQNTFHRTKKDRNFSERQCLAMLMTCQKSETVDVLLLLAVGLMLYYVHRDRKDCYY